MDFPKNFPKCIFDIPGQIDGGSKYSWSVQIYILNQPKIYLLKDFLSSK